MDEKSLNKNQRTPVSVTVQAAVLTASRRKCCICYYLHGERRVRKGQIAHLNQDRSDSVFENLVFLCLEHHDEFDSQTSQSKGLIPQEIRVHRDRMYQELRARPLRKNQQTVQPQIEHTIKQLPVPLRRALRRARGQFDYLLTPWRLTVYPEVRSFLFAYKSCNRIDGICRIEPIVLRDGRVAIICIQIPGNPGMSITNTVETIAFQVCHQFKIEPSKLVWIEHYLPRIFGFRKWSLVTFHSYPPRSMFYGPTWQVMDDQDWRDLGLPPRKSDVHTRPRDVPRNEH